MKPNEEILDKVKKILTLANCKGATQGEVEAAIAKAKALAMRYSIDLASVDLSQDEKSASAMTIEADESLRTRSKYKQPYHNYVANTLKKVFGVEVVWRTVSWPGGTEIRKITIIGESMDVAICTILWPYLEKVFPSTLSRLVTAGELTYCAADTNGCYLGIHHGIVEANKREEDKLSKDDAACYAMVVRDKNALIQAMMNKLFPEVKSTKSRARELSEWAYVRGHQEGSKVNLRQVGAGKSSNQIK